MCFRCHCHSHSSSSEKLSPSVLAVSYSINFFARKITGGKTQTKVPDTQVHVQWESQSGMRLCQVSGSRRGRQQVTVTCAVEGSDATGSANFKALLWPALEWPSGVKGGERFGAQVPGGLKGSCIDLHARVQSQCDSPARPVPAPTNGTHHTRASVEQCCFRLLFILIFNCVIQHNHHSKIF